MFSSILEVVLVQGCWVGLLNKPPSTACNVEMPRPPETERGPQHPHFKHKVPLFGLHRRCPYCNEKLLCRRNISVALPTPQKPWKGLPRDGSNPSGALAPALMNAIGNAAPMARTAEPHTLHKIPLVSASLTVSAAMEHTTVMAKDKLAYFTSERGQLGFQSFLHVAALHRWPEA